MKLSLNSDMRIQDACRMFRKYFPYLTPEFYNTPAREQEKALACPPNRVLGEVGQRSLFDSTVELHPKLTVADAEQAFSNTFGLQMRLCRRGPHHWEEILSGESQTLEAQNRMGRVVSRGMYEPDIL
jgi:hypothetical protein